MLAWLRRHQTKAFSPATPAEQQLVQEIYRKYYGGSSSVDFTDELLENYLATWTDPFVVTRAKLLNAVVVTEEIPAKPSSNRVKIPDVCVHEGIVSIGTHEFLRDLGIRLCPPD